MGLCLALMAVAPLASSAITDDTVSRTFPYISGVHTKVANTGIGWYDAASPPNVCLANLRGDEAPSIGSYYENLRAWPNLPGFVNYTSAGTGITVPAPCPAALLPPCTAVSTSAAYVTYVANPSVRDSLALPPSCQPKTTCTLASDCAIQLEPVTVAPPARTILRQDGIICTQQSSFITCIPTASAWTVAACRSLSASFPSRADSNTGSLAGTGLAGLALSQDIDCGGGYTNVSDASYLLGSGGNPLSSGLDGVTASLVIPFGDGADDTGYAVSCLEASYTTIDSSVVPPFVGSAIEDGVDYALVLDLDAPANWFGPLVNHVGVGAGGNSLQGLYDLGGDNDCDFALPRPELPPPPPPPKCHDGLDNDGDFHVDEGDRDCFVDDPTYGLVYDPNANETVPQRDPRTYQYGPVVIQKDSGGSAPYLDQKQWGCSIESETANSMRVSCTPPTEGNWLCHNPGLVAHSDTGPVTGNTWCTNGPTATATSNGGDQWSGVQEGSWDFPWYCEAIFATGSSGHVLCDAPDPPLIWPF